MEHQEKPITIGPRYTLLGGEPWTIQSIGASIDPGMTAAYQAYLNRKTKDDGVKAIKAFQTNCRELVKGCECLYDSMTHQLPIAAPPINRGFRLKVEESLTTWEPFSGRWLTFLQFCQHFSVRCAYLAGDAATPKVEKQVHLLELLYEMHYRAEELLEVTDTVPVEPEEINHG